jgi:hypothetical protein
MVKPIPNDAWRELGYVDKGCVGGGYRLLKNIIGFLMLQECLVGVGGPQQRSAADLGRARANPDQRMCTAESFWSSPILVLSTK